MATLLRTCIRQGRLISSSLPRSRLNVLPACNISTSKKKKDVTAGVVEPMEAKSAEQKELEKHFADADPTKEKNWISYGYDFVDRDMDRFIHNMTMFVFVTVGLCWGGFVLSYIPDNRLKDWCVREAYLEIERREKEGLPLLDPNLIPADKIELPSDEDLADTEVII